MRCVRCDRRIEDTVHTNRRTRVDGYRLHTGKVKQVEAKDNANGAQAYLQLSDPQEVALCVDCFSRTEIHNVWLHGFLAVDQLETLKR
jgi:hypothetical protein